MKARMLVSVAAAALAVGTVLVSAQPGGPGGKGAPSPGAQAPEGQPGQKEGQPKATQPKEGQPKEGQPKAAQPKEDTKQPKAKDKAAEPGKAKDKDAPDRPGGPKEKAATDKPTTTDKPTATGKDKNGAPKGAAGKGAPAKVSTEQRTQIRQTILKQGNAPRVNNVNFNVSIGTTVPSTVQVVVLPPRVIEIYPEWRGYRYFIVGERIVIVEPDSLVIVYIIEA
jgi:Protein of unknown function (DUF1236)